MKALLVVDEKEVDLDLIKKHFDDVLVASFKKDLNAHYVPQKDIYTAFEGFLFLLKIPDILKFDALIFDNEVLPKEVASFFANHFALSLVAHTKDFEINDSIKGIVYSWGDMVLKILAKTKPALFVFDFSSSSKNKFNYSAKEVINFERLDNQEPSLSHMLATLVNRSKKNFSDYIDARIVVGVGLGVKKEVLPLIKEFATLLGAPLSGTRPVADLGYIDRDKFIGDTGIKIKTDVYIAFGISGATQHLEGVHAKNIIAINSDSSAPIFNHATLCINETVEDVIGQLLQWARSF